MDLKVRCLNVEGPVARKIARLASGARPRAIDLFAGCGGISLGFQRADFDILAAMEIDELAARSHAENFYRGGDREQIELHARPRDITRIEPDELTQEFGLGSVEDAVDVLVGGPPCQAYARVGRAKLREIAEHPQAFKVDPRGNLYLRYLAYVRALKPVALMMENVPDILHYGGHNVIEEMVETLDDMGYDAKYSLLNAAFHGVPQMRDRVFLIAFRKELGARIRFPRATRHMTLPSGYEGTRAVALKFVDLLGGSGYLAPDLGSSDLPFAVTASEAIGDLPPITLHLEGKLRRGARRFTELIRYRQTDEISSYAAELRQWPGFESPEGVKDHVIRYLPRDTEIFREMQPGTEYPAAQRVATRLFEQKAKELDVRKGTEAYDELHRRMVPPYRVDTFPNRWWKLRADFPVRTLMAHIGKDTYSHIHYDSAQGRTISVREAARLQSFPDGFILSGTMNPAFKQIGNAVPPLMARALADTIRETLAEALAATVPMAAAQAAE
jgi:DNA (cytosine-5)-methyltransferase 1